MKQIKSLLTLSAVSFFSLILNGQGNTLLKEEQGVSLSYTMQFYKNCKEIPDKEYKIYKITAYLSNRSGKAIKMSDSWVSTNKPLYLNCISEYDNFGSIKFRPSGELNATPQWATNGTPWPNNSTLSGTYYIAIPAKEKEPPTPDWAMGAFIFINDKPNQQPQWSEWRSDPCYPGLSYQYKVTELYNLNKQVYYEFNVKSSYSETVQFVISLRDEYDKERFGTRKTIAGGDKISYTEKMSDNYIKSIVLDKAWFPKDVGKNTSPCDGKRETGKGNEKRGILSKNFYNQVLAIIQSKPEDVKGSKIGSKDFETYGIDYHRSVLPLDDFEITMELFQIEDGSQWTLKAKKKPSQNNIALFEEIRTQLKQLQNQGYIYMDEKTNPNEIESSKSIVIYKGDRAELTVVYADDGSIKIERSYPDNEW